MDSATVDSGVDSGVDAAPDDPCDPDPCMNGGTCDGATGAAVCTCAAGFEGDTCETNIDDCDPNPCMNGGTCEDGVDAFTCMCATDFTGDTCETEIDDCDPNPCMNGGTCDMSGTDVTCTCEAGFEGDRCETNIDDCDPNPCMNGGTCEDGVDAFTCMCTAGYEGDTCDTDIDACATMPCFDGVDCTDNAAPDTGRTCGDCPAGFEGDGETCTEVLDWFQIWGDDNDDTPGGFFNMGAAVDGDDNVYVYGTFGLDMTIFTRMGTSSRAGSYVASFTSDGTFRWATTFGVSADPGGDFDVQRMMIEPTTGDVIIAGDGFGGDALVNGVVNGSLRSNETAFVLRINADTGAPVWSYYAPIDGTPMTGNALGLASDGRILLGGNFQGTNRAVGDGFMIASAGLADGYVLWLDVADGEVSNAIRTGGTGSEGVAAVDGFADGDIAVLLQYGMDGTNLGGIDLTSESTTAAAWGRLNTAGVADYARSLASAGNNLMNDLHVGASGDFYISGRYVGNLSLGAGFTLSGGNFGVYVARFAGATGMPVWVSGTEDGGNANPIGLWRFTLDADENVRFATGIAIGGAGGVTIDGTEIPSTGDNTILVNLDGSDGSLNSVRAFNMSSGVIRGFGLGVTSTGNSVVAGYFQNTGTLFGLDFELAGAAGADHFVLQFANE